MTDTIIIATPDELARLLEVGDIDGDGSCITLSALFDVLLDYYGYQPGFAPNDVY